MKDLTKLNAYTLIKTEDLPDVNGTGYYLRHNKSGARVVWVENEDDNKVFSIAFRTPPTDSTGVAHIIEHTVLCGSERFLFPAGGSQPAWAVMLYFHFIAVQDDSVVLRAAASGAKHEREHLHHAAYPGAKFVVEA